MFKHCPQCSAKSLDFLNDKQINCTTCDFTYFHNAVAAVMCILIYDSKIIMAVRNQDPEKGRLDLVGGFVDPGENAEQALKRELQEELGIKKFSWTYLGSAANDYYYEGVLYKTCDMIYLVELTEFPTYFDAEEIQELRALYPDEIKEKDIGFKSVHEALRLYRKWCPRNSSPPF